MKNPTVGVEFPRRDMQKKQLHYWTIDQDNTFLKAVKNHKEPNDIWYPFFMLLIDTGMRKGEAMALQWDDFDLSRDTVSINKTRLYRKGKGEYQDSSILDDPKTSASVHIVSRGKEKFYGDSHFVFRYTSKRSFDRVIREALTSHAFVRLCELVDLPEIIVHDLRHTHAVALREAGVSMDDIRGVLGHRSLQTT